MMLRAVARTTDSNIHQFLEFFNAFMLPGLWQLAFGGTLLIYKRAAELLSSPSPRLSKKASGLHRGKSV
jgi:hypothetical protein